MTFLKFTKNQYPSKTEIEQICNELEKSSEKIRNWFKHQRKRDVTQGKWKFTVLYYIYYFTLFYRNLTSRRKIHFRKRTLQFSK